jgi:S1-C subfamily serine protease
MDGGLVVAGVFLGLGVTGRRSTRTIVEEAPIASAQASNTGSGLTPHAIYQRDAPGVVFVRANIVRRVQDPFDLFREQQRSTSTGSGFLVDRSGDILTTTTAGRVIGINSQIATGGDGVRVSVGIAFAIPIDTAAPILAHAAPDNGG